LFAALAICCGTTLLAIAGGAGLLGAAAGWLAGGVWLAIPIAIAAAQAARPLAQWLRARHR
jgi:hypothetical protein